jgi:hypothetical protein
MKNTNFLKTVVLILALSTACHAQSFTAIKRQVDAPLVLDGREMKGPHDSLSKEELLRLFNENKATVGHTAMQVIGITISWLPPKKDLVGPFTIDTRAATGMRSIDTLAAAHQKIAAFLKTHLDAAHQGDKVFIETFCTPATGGAPARLKLPAVFVLK